MKNLNITRRNDGDWNTNSGETIKKGMFYVIIDEKPNKIKLAGHERHWALVDKFNIIDKGHQDNFITLVDEKEDMYSLRIHRNHQSRNDSPNPLLKDAWNLSEDAIHSLYECISYIKEKGEQSLIAWAVENN